MPLSYEDAQAAQRDVDRTRRVTADQIPIVDVAGLLNGNIAAEQKAVRGFADAFHNIGFCYVVNHGVPQDMIDRAFAALPSFFELPEEEKRKIPINRNQRGWLGMNGQVQLHGKLPNLSESFMFGLDLPKDDPDRMSGLPFYDTNQWPESLPEFRTTMEEYWSSVRGLAPKLMRGLALSMRQRPDFFEPLCRKPPAYIRCVTYPPASGPFNGQFGAGPHTDTSGLTILAQDDVGGLQIRMLNGDWIDAPTMRGAFVVNIGDMIMRLTNGFFKSTPHRVVCGARRRYSLPFFFGFDYKVRIEPLPEFCSEDNPPRFSPVIWGEYAMRSFSKQYSQFKTDA